MSFNDITLKSTKNSRYCAMTTDSYLLTKICYTPRNLSSSNMVFQSTYEYDFALVVIDWVEKSFKDTKKTYLLQCTDESGGRIVIETSFTTDTPNSFDISAIYYFKNIEYQFYDEASSTNRFKMGIYAQVSSVPLKPYKVEQANGLIRWVKGNSHIMQIMKEEGLLQSLLMDYNTVPL